MGYSRGVGGKNAACGVKNAIWGRNFNDICRVLSVSFSIILLGNMFYYLEVILQW